MRYAVPLSRILPGLVFLALGWLPGAPTARAEDRALLVGIEKYADRRIPALPGCEADATEMANLIKQAYGMPDRQVKVLLSSQATSRNIVTAFSELLIEGTQAGDRVVFYFSGHGSQVKDTNGDEEDGWDEVLCPSDYDPVTQKNGIVDDELGALLNRLDGRNITLIFDSCHSGTAYKSIQGEAFLDPLYATTNVIAKFIPPPSATSQPADQGPSIRARAISLPAGRAIVDTVSKNMVVFSACADGERAEIAGFIESGRVSPRSVFTRALLQGLAGRADADGDGTITNEDAIAFARRMLRQPGREFTQTPQLQCRQLFEQQPVFDRTFTLGGPDKLIYIRDKEAAVNRGSYHDIKVGDRFVASGESGSEDIRIDVTRVDAFLSFGRASKDIRIGPSGMTVRHAIRLEPFRKLGLFWGRFTDARGKAVDIPAAIRNAVATIPDVRVVGTQDQCDRIAAGVLLPDGTVQLFLYGRFGCLLGQLSEPLAAAPAAMVRWLTGQVLLERLASLNNPDAAFHVNLSVKNGRTRYLVYPKGDPRREKIELVLKADRDCYVTVLSIDSQGQVLLLLPNRWQPQARLQAGRECEIPGPGADFVLPIQEPPGCDAVKVVATLKPLNLRSVTPKGSAGQGLLQFDAEQGAALVQEIFTRGIGVDATEYQSLRIGQDVPGALRVSDWTTAEITVQTLPAPDDPARKHGTASDFHLPVKEE